MKKLQPNQFLEKLTDSQKNEFDSFMHNTTHEIVKILKPKQTATVNNHITLENKIHLVVEIEYSWKDLGLSAIVKDIQELTLDQYLDSLNKVKKEGKDGYTKLKSQL